MSMKDAEKAINRVFGDTSVSSSTTRYNLEVLRDLIDDNLMSLKNAEDEDEE